MIDQLTKLFTEYPEVAERLCANSDFRRHLPYLGMETDYSKAPTALAQCISRIPTDYFASATGPQSSCLRTESPWCGQG